MKKILTLIATAILAFGTLETARADASVIYNTTKTNTFFTAGGELFTTTGSNYVAMFLYSDTSMESLAPIGMSGFYSDFYGIPSNEHGFYWNSEPASPLTTLSGEVGYLGLVIFQLTDADMISLTGGTSFADDDAWDAAFGGLSASQMKALWDNAMADSSGEYGLWGGAYTAGPGGSPGGNAVFTPLYRISDNLDLHGQELVRGSTIALEPIPEPATWLLLGAGAAFVVIMRRRKAA